LTTTNEPHAMFRVTTVGFKLR